ncbi:FtsX-like permease family protein [Polluticoccus soli]|uniref:FtsX-like permease family protein n=1 Tax=Polluticoccus soli TaxID=3034150 RepID=UPI0023E1084B|nr:FtsX-like permease family protein [Flavipsychrobacter sp. JY13-12]
MNSVLTRQLALRYLRGKRTANIVPILSRISMTAIAVASAAMIILFSVLNGFTDLVSDLYKAFYPEIKITATRGKFFSLDAQQMASVRSIEGVSGITTVLEDNVLLTGNDETKVAMLKGIDQNYLKVNEVKPYVIEGTDSVSLSPAPTALMGLQLANEMGLDITNAFSTLVLHYPNAKSSNLALNPTSAFQTLQLKPDGVFQVQDEFDSKYILAPLPLVQELMQTDGQYSSVELKLAANTSADRVQRELSEKLGKNFTVATRFEQNKTLYMVMKSEKWAVFAILVLVLLIASFNMVGALTMLVLEKQKDMSILKAMGAEPSTVRNIFLAEGVLWALTGGVIGLFVGALISMGQKHFQWIKMQGNFIIEAYPVSLEWWDFVLILGTILLVGLAAAWYPAYKAQKAQVHLRSN